MAEIDINEAMASLEMLMSEFFAPVTSNARKREIESILENFSRRRDSWKHCLMFLQHSQNQYVLMFTLTTLQNIINKLWIIITDEEKTQIRLTLWNELITKHEVLPIFIRNKLASLMVSIARYDWPHLYTDFFHNIIELLQCDGQKCILGLVLANAASEELGAAHDTGVLLPSARRNQLERLMLKGMPQMLAALSAILEKNALKEGHTNPPPSPTSGIPASSSLDALLANAHDSADKALNMEIVVKCLTTLQHLFSWLPLSSHVPPSLVTTVFYWGSIATQSQSEEAALAGLSGLCELLYRRYAPPSSHATALRLHHCALRLLRHLTHTRHIPTADHQYLNKLAEFLRLFVSLHFKRLEAEPEFDAIEFLSYLFQYTFQVPTCDIYVNCLEVWKQFIAILKMEDVPKYWEALRALVNSILNKLQFQHNKAQLQHIDKDNKDDDGETEWNIFLKRNIEVVARVADLAPLDIFTIVFERWQGLAGVHARAFSRASSIGQGAEGERLLIALLDLGTLTRALGRLAPCLLNVSECNKEMMTTCRSAGGALIERVAGALAQAHTQQPAPAHLAQVHAEMFACMGAWCCYAYSCGVTPQTMQSLFRSAMPFLLPQEVPNPPVVSLAAAHMILSLSISSKFTNDPMILVGELYENALQSLDYLEPQTRIVVRECLLTLTLSRHCVGAGHFAKNLLAAWTSQITAGPTVVLPPLTELLKAFSHHPTHAKKILAESLRDVAEMSLRVLCSPQPVADQEITDFFLALFTALLPQLGNFACTAIDVFLEVAQRHGGSRSIERLVECVRLGVEAGGGLVRVGLVLALLQHTEHSAGDAPDLARANVQLLHSLLVNQWRYFFPLKCEENERLQRTQELRVALTALGRGLLQSDIESLKITLHTLEDLNTKWKLYHKVIFRNEFMSEFLTVLLSGLVEGGPRALIREEACVAAHAMASVDFNAFRRMFLPNFLRSLPGLDNYAKELLDNFPAETDLPTFTQNIERLMNDVNCYIAYNSLTAPHMVS